MKRKLFSFLVIIAFAGILFTSCLGDGNVKYTAPYYAEFTSDNEFYRPMFNIGTSTFPYFIYGSNEDMTSTLQEGGCYSLLGYFESKQQTTTKYTTVRIEEKPTFIPGGNINSHMSPQDTLVVLGNEIPIKGVGKDIGGNLKFLFRGNHLIIELATDNPKDADIEYTIQYSEFNEPMIDGEKRIYDFFFRAVMIKDGEKPKERDDKMIAFKIWNSIENINRNEEGRGAEEFYIRFNYAGEIDSEKGNKLKWSRTEPQIFPVFKKEF